MSHKSRKVFNNRYRKIRNRMIACVLFAILILVFWHYISDLHKHIDLLAKYNHDQSTEINTLQHEISSQHSEITNLQHQVTYITNKETASIKVQFHHNTSNVSHVSPNNKYSNIEDAVNYTPTIIVTAVTIIGGLIRNLVPSF